VGSKRLLWVKVNSDYDILFRLMGNLRLGEENRYWITAQGTEGNIEDTREALEQMGMEVKITLPVSHNS